ncbi:MAG: CHAT domain-containing protein [Proteobacteria bacterium]|nr:CHAT domain-containing protein [Pseudomonadota bacterium]
MQSAARRVAHARRGTRAYVVLVVGLLAAPTGALGASARCEYADVGARDRPLRATVTSRAPATFDLPIPAGRDALVEVTERGLDMHAEVLAPDGRVLARADNPVERSGTLRVAIGAHAGHGLAIRVSSKEERPARGEASVRVRLRLPANRASSCRDPVRRMAEGDADYAAGQDVSLARAAGTAAASRHAYLRAREHYLIAYDDAEATAATAIRTEAALALAAIEYQNLKEWSRAAEWARRAQAGARAAGDEYAAARAANLLAAAWLEQPTMRMDGEAAAPEATQRLAEARALFARSEAVHLRRGERYDAALNRNYIGVAYFNESDYRRAEAAHRAAASTFRALREEPKLGAALQNIATCQWGRGELLSADRTFREAARHMTATSNPHSYMFMRANQALLDHELGHLDDALRLANDSLAMAEQLAAPIPIGSNLLSLGITYYALGDRAQSRYYLERARAHHTPDVRSYSSTLRALATVYRDEGRRDESRAVARQALALAISPLAKARIEVGIARDDAALGGRDAARAALDRILASGVAREGTVRVDALLARAELRAATRDLDGAGDDLREALRVLTALEDPSDELQARLALARVERDQGSIEAALAEVNRALALADTLRNASANPVLRAQRQEPLRPVVELKVGLLMALRLRQLAAGDAAGARRREVEALAAAEASRARSLADIEAEEASAAGAGSLARLRQRRADLDRELVARQYQLDARRDTAGDDDARARRYQAELATLRRESDLLSARIARESGGRARRGLPAPEEWVRALRTRSPDTAILEFWVGADATYAWVVTDQGIAFHELGLSAEIADAARALHGSMRSFATTSPSARLEAAAALYRRALAPLEAEATRYRRWVIVPDGALSYVPFAALVDGESNARRYLIQRHDLAVTPAAWWLLRARERRPDPGASRELLVVADPVYGRSDVRAGAAAAAATPTTGREWPRLPWTAREADGIAQLFPSRAVDRLEGLAATRERMLGAPLGDYRFIHVASHGYVDAALPQLSAIILGAYGPEGPTRDRAVRASDLESVRLRAEVVTLSACDTALGKEAVGEGVMGISYMALARGARAVVASLWQVPDEMTVAVMTDFYRNLLQRGDASMALAEAMRAALVRSPQLDPAIWSAYQVSLGGPLRSGPPPTAH